MNVESKSLKQMKNGDLTNKIKKEWRVTSLKTNDEWVNKFNGGWMESQQTKWRMNGKLTNKMKDEWMKMEMKMKIKAM